MRDLQLLINLLILSILGLFTFIIISFNTNKDINSGTTYYGGFCGTSSLYHYPEGAENGKILFKNNCAMCHAKNMVSWATGPPLGSTIKKWQNDTTSYQLFLLNSLAYVEKPNPVRRDSLVSLYKMEVNYHDFNLERQEVKDLIAYIEMW